METSLLYKVNTSAPTLYQRWRNADERQMNCDMRDGKKIGVNLQATVLERSWLLANLAHDLIAAPHEPLSRFDSVSPRLSLNRE
jgi:hypothetical protein